MKRSGGAVLPGAWPWMFFLRPARLDFIAAIHYNDKCRHWNFLPKSRLKTYPIASSQEPDLTAGLSIAVCLLYWRIDTRPSTAGIFPPLRADSHKGDVSGIAYWLLARLNIYSSLKGSSFYGCFFRLFRLCFFSVGYTYQPATNLRLVP